MVACVAIHRMRSPLQEGTPLTAREDEDAEDQDFEDRLRRRIEAYHEAALAYAAVKLAIPETMGSKQWTARSLAAALEVSAPHLERLLRGLVTIELVELRGPEAGEHRYGLAKAGQALAPGSASTLRDKLLIVIEQYWRPWAELASTVTSGHPAFETVFGMSVGDWRRATPTHGAAFDAYVARETFAHAAPVLDRLDIAGINVVADLGGGQGGLLGAVLKRAPHLQGVLVGPSQTQAAAMVYLRSLGVAERAVFVVKDIEITVPQIADLYLLNGVLQAQDDAGARRILDNCRKALKPGNRLVIVERLMPDRATDDNAADDTAAEAPAAVILDLHMMTITGGKVRTKDEMEALILEAQLSVAKYAHTDDGRTLIETGVC